ncbi:MAG TPA: response regulator [Verrucomicrobiae bacterium]|nr:response regulator [Verrucomicrobiae bacterium]
MNKTCILQVEDDANDVFLLQRSFREAGITNPLQVATDGQMAIDYLAGAGPYANRARYPLPGLILLDLKLPHKSGREVLQWIRSQPGLRRIVVVVFTTAQYVGDVGLAYDLGANCFLVKPSDFTHYVRIAHLLKGWWLEHNQFAPLMEAAWPLSSYSAKLQRLFEHHAPDNPS